MHSHEDHAVAEGMVFLLTVFSLDKKLNNPVDKIILVCYGIKKHYHSFII